MASLIDRVLSLSDHVLSRPLGHGWLGSPLHYKSNRVLCRQQKVGEGYLLEDITGRRGRSGRVRKDLKIL